MSRISVKHRGQETMSYSDFSGGLNTSAAREMIAMNELSKAVNVELDAGTGLLRTVAGTDTVYLNEGKDFESFFFDRINETFVLSDSENKVYFYQEGVLTEKGTLTGTMFPQYAIWEDGCVIASGGKLQYAHGGQLETLSNSPDVCKGAFVKDGRIWTYYDDRIHASAVGDETSWEPDSEVDSSAQWIEIGYKGGGKVAGVTNLSSDLLIFKDNGHAFHLYGQYPDWTLKEISRDIQCRNDRSCVSLANQAIVLGNSLLQSVTTTDTYGDMRADDISRKVSDIIKSMPDTVRLKYLPSVHQIWFLTGKRRFLFMDCRTGAFFERKFTSPAKDAQSVNDDVYVLKGKRIQKLKEHSPEDEGQEMQWEFWGKTVVSPNEYLVKRIRVSITVEADIRHECMFAIGDVPVHAKMPRNASTVYQDKTAVFQSTRPVYEPHTEPEYTSSEVVFQNREEVYQSDMPLVSPSMYKTDVRCVHRARAVRMMGRGTGGKFLFNSVSYEYVEV